MAAMLIRRPLPAIFVLLASLNIGLWVAAWAEFHAYPLLLGTAFLAYGFGLRHAVDADHIAAIDNVTRKLMQQGQRPLGVGLFFSAGHSTIVFGLSAAVALTSVALESRFAAIAHFGNIAGTLVSAGFLLAIALMNIGVLVGLYRGIGRARAGFAQPRQEIDQLLAGRGFFNRIFRGLFRLVEHDWQMYPIGILFGLGFDTATEVGLLGISAEQATKGLPIWSIMIFPCLFAAGMALIDTADSVLMLGVYGWARLRPVRTLYYNLALTFFSVLVAVLVGGIEMAGLFRSAFSETGMYWDAVAALNDHFGLIGYLIIGVFGLSWVIALLFYKLRRYGDIETAAD